MNMRLPKYLWDKDPVLCNVPQHEPVMDASEYEWMAEALENFERQVEQDLMEEAFIEACFEEMLAEEEAEWHHYTQTDTYMYTMLPEQSNTDYRYLQTANFSKLNPEAPEFVPRGTWPSS